MRDRKEEAEKLAAQSLKAAQKVKSQDERVRRMNGNAHEHPEDQSLLNEMRQNQATIDFNRALFEYEEEDTKEID